MELELELELKIMELELELNWKNGIDPNPVSYMSPAPEGTCTVSQNVPSELTVSILGRELGPSGGSPNQRSQWKVAFSPLKHV